ncbi:MAG: Gfo/Idh/MocA family oxidoreductase [Chloroflexi bacterium]|nr:Gfo/Idh/MocA family oxidoreductase [Chloroflexota bacterium]
MTTAVNTKPVKIGMMSFAHGHAYSYLHALHNNPGVTVVGVYDEDTARGQSAAEQNKTQFLSAEALLAQDLDGVIICSENAKHRPMVEMAAGKVSHILCEKTIYTSMADAQAMIDICAKTNTKLQIAFPVRFAPTIQALKQTLDNGELGKVFAVQATNHGSMPGGWFIDKALAGGGAVLDHTVHVIDVLRWFWGTEVTEVYAEIGDSLLHPGLGIDDAGLLSFKLANGIYGTLDTSWSRLASYTTWGDVKIEITAENGLVFVDSLKQHLAVSSEQVGKTRWQGWGSNMDQGLINDFIGMIREDRAPSITGEDGLRAMEVALAAYRSAETGKPVQLPLG